MKEINKNVLKSTGEPIEEALNRSIKGITWGSF